MSCELSERTVSSLDACIERQTAAPAANATSPAIHHHIHERVSLVGLVSAMRRVHGASGEVMQFATLEDEHGLVEAVVSAPVFARLGDPIRHPGPYWVEATVLEDHGALSLRVEDVRVFAQRSAAWQEA